jgi:phosphoribosylamine--glycine ligase
MKVVVFGRAGGREQALARKMREQGHVVVLSTNPEAEEADLFVGGPEAPLVEGVADRLRAQGKLVFGPGADGAQLEGSKIWMKQLLTDAGVPTARWRSGTIADLEVLLKFIDELGGNAVVKTDYLAGGKGAAIWHDAEAAKQDVINKCEPYGSGKAVVVEEVLDGLEFSVFAVCDGKQAVSFGSAQDYKYLPRDGELLMTGGVGSYSPVDWVTPELTELVMETCIRPTLKALQARGIDYRGVLYWGGMLLDQGSVITLEFNIRFGDPEIQSLLDRLENDLAVVLLQAAQGNLVELVKFNNQASVCVVLCDKHYPNPPVFGGIITGIEDAEAVEGVHVLHAGTSISDSGEVLVTGGRCLNVVATAHSVGTARLNAYQAVNKIKWPGMQYHPGIALP